MSYNKYRFYAFACQDIFYSNQNKREFQHLCNNSENPNLRKIMQKTAKLMFPCVLPTKMYG